MPAVLPAFGSSPFAFAVDGDGNPLQEVPSDCYVIPLRGLQKRLREFDSQAASYRVVTHPDNIDTSFNSGGRVSAEQPALLHDMKRVARLREEKLREFEFELQALLECVTIQLDNRYFQVCHVNARKAEVYGNAI